MRLISWQKKNPTKPKPKQTHESNTMENLINHIWRLKILKKVFPTYCQKKIIDTKVALERECNYLMTPY